RGGTDHLQRRWLAQQCFAKLKSALSLDRVAISFDQSCTAADPSTAADVCSYFSSYHERQSLFSQMEFFASPALDLASLDQQRSVRRSYLDHYRAWMNEEPDVMTSTAIRDRLQSFATQHNLRFACLERDDLVEKGLNLLAAVGQASTRSPSR